jgi:BlaI family penicillinase repressor
MKISEAESRVLEVFWRAAAPLSAEDVVSAMDNDREWSAGTIRTFLARLVKKGALAASPDGRRYLYEALLRREDYVHEVSRELIDRLFGGSVAAFVMQFAERQQLSRADIGEIEQLVARLEPGA